MPRTEAPERRRTDLLDAAGRIVLEKGVAGLTVDEVTARAEVAKGTFYLYFRSKEQLLGALRDRFVDQLNAGQQAELDRIAADNWTGRLLCWMESSIRGYLEHAELHDALFLHIRSPGRHGHASLHAHLSDPTISAHAAALLGILEAGTRSGAFALADPHAATVLLYNAMHGSADYLVEQIHHPEAKALANAVIAESLSLCRRYVQPSNQVDAKRPVRPKRTR